MKAYFDYHHTVSEDEIDAQNHVHNLRYLQWTLWAAGAHTRDRGWDTRGELARGFGWVVRSHKATYRAAAVGGDQIVVRTWVSEIDRFASRRKCLVCRPADRTLLTRVETRWVYVNLKSHKVVAIPPQVHEQFVVLQTAPLLPWE
ncbi:MAG: acyl-CoA thioesterase [Pirellulales bacterium]|nr:acyl-CoA thioesterase [Pirellulales bacterium]